MKKYNLSEIMTKANALRRVYGMSKSEALRKAWGMAKLANLEYKAAMVANIDHWSSKDREQAAQLSKEITALENAIYPRKTVTRRVWTLSNSYDMWERMLNNLAKTKGTDSEEYRTVATRIASGWVINEYTAIDTAAYDVAA